MVHFMKKFVILSVLACFLLQGCDFKKEGYSTYDRNGITFEYPDYLSISNDAEDSANIIISKKSITQTVKGCLSGDDTLEERDRDTTYYYTEGLKSLKEIGSNPNIYRVDTIGCGWTAGNIKTDYAKVNDLNSVIFAKCECQDDGEIDSFRMQFLTVDWYDQVYTVDFNFDFGKLKPYMAELRRKNKEAEGYESTMIGGDKIDEWHEVYDFLSKNKPIKSKEMGPFKENFDVIQDVIKTINIKKTY